MQVWRFCSPETSSKVCSSLNSSIIQALIQTPFKIVIIHHGSNHHFQVQIKEEKTFQVWCSSHPSCIKVHFIWKKLRKTWHSNANWMASLFKNYSLHPINSHYKFMSFAFQATLLSQGHDPLQIAITSWNIEQKKRFTSTVHDS